MVNINHHQTSFNYGSIAYDPGQDHEKVSQANHGDVIFSFQNGFKKLVLFFIVSTILLLTFISTGNGVGILHYMKGDEVSIITEPNNKSNSDDDVKYNPENIQDEEFATRENTILLPTEQVALLRDHRSVPPPFSTLNPVSDLNVYPYKRDSFSSPGIVFGDKLRKGQSETGIPLPTNKWYENMVLMPDSQIAPDDESRVYTVPYVVGTNGPVPGIKLGSTRLLGMEKVVQVTFVDEHGLTLGAAQEFSKSTDNTFGNDVQRRYTLFDDNVGEDVSDTDDYGEASPIKNHSPLTPLGFTIKWKATAVNASLPFQFMSSSIVRGMPYGTMNYEYDTSNGVFGSILPTVVSQLKLYAPPVADSNVTLTCSKSRNSDDGNEILVQKSVKVIFFQSDITWLIFYSHPVYVRCYDISAGTTDTPFVIQATRLANITNPSDVSIFTSRIALMNNCTLGTNPGHCKNGRPTDMSSYDELLHKHADVYPGINTKIDYTFFSDEVEDGGEYAYLQYDWDAHHVQTGKFTPENGISSAGLLMYSLPHHREIMRSQSISPNSFEFDDGTSHCTPALNGNACIVDGAAWVLKENLMHEPSFYAPRPPMASAILNLANAINEDIKFRIPDYFLHGAGDTYFSGKILAKLSRILIISEEVKEICSKPMKYGKSYVHACSKVKLPTKREFNDALDNLRSGTEIWINGTAETPFVYDDKWGGICSCGCLFNGETQRCDNAYPNCPAFQDPGLDFGHAFYNDHHFHQGYHIYAAATVAHFDNHWGRKHFEHVLLLVRDIANPTPLDEFFPVFRMKDWYLGNSWAGGIARAYPNGRNQESSSESIAAYEAISMFGKVMANIFEKEHDIDSNGKASVSRHIRDVGRLLTATELRSADRYWHVRQSGDKSGIYPPQYKPLVVGIMWNMMAQFQTWFGNAPHLAYGIQLLPLTPVSERRDALDWITQLYPSFAESCSNAPECKDQGWGILQHALLAELGHPDLAIEYAESLPDDAYLSAGGNGHSLTNTIWYYSTRPATEPIVLPDTPSPSPKVPSPASTNVTSPTNVTTTFNCGCPETCTKEVLDYPAGGYTCGIRIKWLIDNVGKSEHDACSLVSGIEFTDMCAGCDPNRCIAPMVSPKEESTICPACTTEQCRDGILNKCPVLDAPFLCIDGVNKGGCSMVPWNLNTTGGSNCNKCCQLTYQCE